MKLGKALKIIKSGHFTVFVHQKGYIRRRKQGSDETCMEIIEISRDKKGKLPPVIKYADKPVREIIPHSSGVNLTIEI